MLEEEGWGVHRKFLETQHLSMRKYDKLDKMSQKLQDLHSLLFI